MRIVGAGRAGQSFAAALTSVGYDIEVVPRGSPVEAAAEGVDGVLIATPDQAIAEVAATIRPGAAVLLHCSGATTLTALAPHEQRGSVHPLMALPSPQVGSERLLDGGWFAVDGHKLAAQLVGDLGGRSFVVSDERRALYHATAAVSANHLVALLGQVERLADLADVPAQAFLDLARGSFDDVEERGAAASLTGPAARGDHATLRAHLSALPEAERDLYETLMHAAQKLADSSRR